MKLKLSPQACDELIDFSDTSAAEDLEGATDCPDGCEVEPDGYCPHGYLSAAETLLRTVA